MRRFALLLVLFPALLSACATTDPRSSEIDRLQAQLDRDREFLSNDAATADPSRPDLKATFVESSIMDIRPTNNPDRPYVAHVRIKWKFDHADGRALGYAVWDYVYAIDKTGRWFKADEAQPGDPALPVPRVPNDTPLPKVTNPKPA